MKRREPGRQRSRVAEVPLNLPGGLARTLLDGPAHGRAARVRDRDETRSDDDHLREPDQVEPEREAWREEVTEAHGQIRSVARR